jgi:hypothetical protein
MSTKQLENLLLELVFCNNMVALHGDSVWEHQNKWSSEKEAKGMTKKNAAKRLFLAKKDKCDEIRKRPIESWTVDNINTLLTYKRQKKQSGH